MNTKQLRQKILDLAIRGKLVPQDPNDEPASVLLARVKAEKERLIVEGKIKRSKKKATTADKPHYPFELPKGWVWSRLDEICEIKGGKRIPRGLKLSDLPTEHVYIRVTDMKNNTVDIGDLKYITDEIYQQIKNYTISSEDLYITIAGTIGRVGTVPLQLNNANLTENAAKLTNIKCARKYLMFALLSDIAQEHFTSKFHQVAQPKLSIETASKTLVPVPPIKEQRRIVNAVEQIFDIIFELDSSIDELSKSITQCKAKILELAISGRLVPQDPADEPAEELLRRINPAAVPADKSHYALPSNWVWVKGKDLFLPMKSTTPKGDTFKYIDIDSIDNKNQCISAIKVLPTEKAPSRASRFTEKGNILFSMVRPYLRNIAIVTEEDCIASTGFYVCRQRECLDHKYLYYLMTSNYVVDGLNSFMKGDNSPSINKGNVDEYVFPLPPLNEQKRIVAKVDELFAVIDQIQQSLE